VTQITTTGHFEVIDDNGIEDVIFTDECIELEEYKNKLIQERFEQKQKT